MEAPNGSHQKMDIVVMPSELISIIIPVFNQSNELLLSLKSIKRQTYPNLEIIVIDDGSKETVNQDKVKSILQDIPWQLIIQKNQGAPVARNKGFSLSKGDFVIFWDADVIAEPDTLEKMFVSLQKHQNSSFAYCNFVFGRKQMHSRKFDINALQKNNYITTTSLIRRKDFPKFDESLNRFQDWDLWLTMAEQKKTGIWINECLIRILINKNGISTWLPKFAYYFPFKYLPGIAEKVKKYESARDVIKKKHGI